MSGTFIHVAQKVDGVNIPRECMQLMQVRLDKGKCVHKCNVKKKKLVASRGRKEP